MPETLKVITNNRRREIETDDDGLNFFTYHGHRYLMEDFLRLSSGCDLGAAGWHGCLAESYWSGVLVRYVWDVWGSDVSIIVGRYVVVG